MYDLRDPDPPLHPTPDEMLSYRHAYLTLPPYEAVARQIVALAPPGIVLVIRNRRHLVPWHAVADFYAHQDDPIWQQIDVPPPLPSPPPGPFTPKSQEGYDNV